jgi:hypothetical protein
VDVEEEGNAILFQIPTLERTPGFLKIGFLISWRGKHDKQVYSIREPKD